jgi:FKBP-type peptidyl-prolyl cis-trans isomerase
MIVRLRGVTPMLLCWVYPYAAKQTINNPKVTTRLAFLAGLAIVIVSCIDPLEVPPCNETTVTPVSSSADTVITNTGLKYVEGAVGRGAPAAWCETLAVHYTAYLLDGTRFDSTEVNNPLIFTPGLGGLIDGLEQGVIGMRLEGTRRLVIPPALAFGPTDRRDQFGNVFVPANSTVVFDLTILGVNITGQ